MSGDDISNDPTEDVSVGGMSTNAGISTGERALRVCAIDAAHEC